MKLNDGFISYNPLPVLQQAYAIANQPFSAPTNTTSTVANTANGTSQTTSWLNLEQKLLGEYQQSGSTYPVLNNNILDTTV